MVRRKTTDRAVQQLREAVTRVDWATVDLSHLPHPESVREAITALCNARNHSEDLLARILADEWRSVDHDQNVSELRENILGIGEREMHLRRWIDDWKNRDAR